MAIPINAVEEAILEYKGNLSAVARSFEISRTAVVNRVARSDRLKKAVQQARESRTDRAEDRLGDLIEDGNTAAIIFYLKTQGKDRGYIERQELTGADGDKLTITVLWDDAPDHNAA